MGKVFILNFFIAISSFLVHMFRKIFSDLSNHLVPKIRQREGIWVHLLWQKVPPPSKNTVSIDTDEIKHRTASCQVTIGDVCGNKLLTPT